MTYRVIYSLHIHLVGPNPGLGPELIVGLGPDGRKAQEHKHGNGRSRTGKRAIDLRVGDEILCGGKWLTIERIQAYRENWCTDQEYAARPRNDGYYYKLIGETRTPQELRDMRNHCRP